MTTDHETIRSNSDGLAATIESLRGRVDSLLEAVRRRIVGQEAMVEGLLIGLLTDGHVLLEGVPGLAKTLTVSTLARALSAKFSRIQFTPDLLPADVIGTLIYNPREGTFAARRGPVFANIVLADEINRAPAKVQSALLEAMQERQVTIGESSYRLDDPFLVLATQNPIEQEGTYPLPEAQVDRFMLKLAVTYPTRDQEREILDREIDQGPASSVSDAPVLDLDSVRQMRAAVASVAVDPRIRDYIVELVQTTRGRGARENHGVDARLIEFGASPRATKCLAAAARAHAFLRGRPFVTPSDVKRMAPDVLRHRVVVTYEAQASDASSEEVVRRILDGVPTP